MISSLLVCFAVIATVLVTSGVLYFTGSCRGIFLFPSHFHSNGGSGVPMIALIVLLALIVVITVGVLLALGSVNWR